MNIENHSSVTLLCNTEMLNVHQPTSSSFSSLSSSSSRTPSSSPSNSVRRVGPPVVLPPPTLELATPPQDSKKSSRLTCSHNCLLHYIKSYIPCSILYTFRCCALLQTHVRVKNISHCTLIITCSLSLLVLVRDIVSPCPKPGPVVVVTPLPAT